MLAAWGKNDPFFLPAGAEAFRRDIPGAKIQFFDTGHFAVESHAKEIAAVSGHRSLAEIERYTARADQAGLAKAAIAKLPDDDVGR